MGSEAPARQVPPAQRKAIVERFRYGCRVFDRARTSWSAITVRWKLKRFPGASRQAVVVFWSDCPLARP